MASIDFPEAVKALIKELKRMPGVGPRSAERIAVWLIQHKRANPVALSDALKLADEDIASCPTCGFFQGAEGCAVCESPNREESVLCVVEQATDVLPLERSGAFQGFYHCLGGKLAPLDNVTPDDLRIPQLLKRVEKQPGLEVILALTADVEGEATSNYLCDILARYNCKVTRIAQGLPAGGGLENADQLTLLRALQGRR